MVSVEVTLGEILRFSRIRPIKSTDDELTPEQRFARIAEILGRGLVRLQKNAALKRKGDEREDVTETSKPDQPTGW